MPEASVSFIRESDKLLKRLSKFFPPSQFSPPTCTIYEDKEAEPNQNPFAYLESIERGHKKQPSAISTTAEPVTQNRAGGSKKKKTKT